MPEAPLNAFMRIPSLRHPVPSPDGKRIAVVGTEGTETSLRVLDLENGTGEVTIHDAEGRPLWGPQGDTVYYLTCNAGTTTIRATDLRGDSEQLVSEEQPCILQDVSPSGQFLFYSTEGALWRYDRVEREAIRLVTDVNLLPGPAYPLSSNAVFCSPDGTRIAYTIATDEDEDRERFHPVGQIYISRVDGTEQRALTIETGPIDAAGDALLTRGWHPDSQRLLITDHPFAGYCGVFDIERDDVRWFGTDLDASDVPFPGLETPLTFRPDGDGFVAWRLQGATKRLAVYALDGDAQLFDLRGEVSRRDTPEPRFLDADSIVFVRETETEPGTLVAFNVRSGESDSIFTVDYGDVDSDEIVTPERVQYPTATGNTAPGVLYASGADASPAIVEVYSGYPEETGWPRTFSRYIHFLAARGYTVFQAVNPAAHSF